RGRHRQRRADAEDMDGDRILVDQRIGQLLHSPASPLRRLSMKGPKPSGPSQKCTMSMVPELVTEAPAIISTSESPDATETVSIRITSPSKMRRPVQPLRNSASVTRDPKPGVSPCS